MSERLGGKPLIRYTVTSGVKVCLFGAAAWLVVQVVERIVQ